VSDDIALPALTPNPRGRTPLLVLAVLVGAWDFILIVYALLRQIVIEGTSEASYLQWSTRPLFFCAVAALVACVFALVLVVLRRVPVGSVALVLAVVLMAIGGAIAVHRQHPLAHERSILNGVRLPAAYRGSDYRPTTTEPIGDHNPPTIVRTWTAAIDPGQACRDTAAALAASPMRTLKRYDDQIGPACTWSGEVDGWPVFVEVDAPGDGTLAEVPGPGDAQQPSAVAAGFSRVDIWAQPPDAG
jgi:hypothetical protein